MPWLSIIVWLVTFLLSSQKEGVSKGKAALLATGAALGTYYLADPSNPDNLLSIGQTAGDAVTDANAGSVTNSGAAGALGTVGSVLTSPTLPAVIMATGAAAGTGIFGEKWLPWAVGIGALILLSR